MSQDIFLIAYDGHDRPVVDYAIALARKQSARLYIVHVLEWSPYRFLSPQEVAERHKYREQELAKANSEVLAPVLEHVRKSGLTAAGEVRHGDPVDTVSAIAKEQGAALILAGRANSLSQRVFGSTASGLAQYAPVPTVIVP